MAGAIIDARFCMPQPVNLIMHERGGLRNDSATITGAFCLCVRAVFVLQRGAVRAAGSASARTCFALQRDGGGSGGGGRSKRALGHACSRPCCCPPTNSPSSTPFEKTTHHIKKDDQGRLFFSQDARLLSLADKRVLLDAYGAPCVAIARKLVSLRGSFQIYRGASFEPQHKVAEIKPAMLSLMPILKVCLFGWVGDAVLCRVLRLRATARQHQH